MISTRGSCYLYQKRILFFIEIIVWIKWNKKTIPINSIVLSRGSNLLYGTKNNLSGAFEVGYNHHLIFFNCRFIFILFCICIDVVFLFYCRNFEICFYYFFYWYIPKEDYFIIFLVYPKECYFLCIFLLLFAWHIKNIFIYIWYIYILIVFD